MVCQPCRLQFDFARLKHFSGSYNWGRKVNIVLPFFCFVTLSTYAKPVIVKGEGGGSFMSNLTVLGETGGGGFNIQKLSTKTNLAIVWRNGKKKIKKICRSHNP